MRTFIVDSFTDEPFKGNPAGVCLTDHPLSEDFMLKVAAELGLSETAFVRCDSDVVRIRYFSPKMEIPLCGHATLAAARVWLSLHESDEVVFQTIQDIELGVSQTESGLSMEFPRYETHPSEAPDALLAALGVSEIKDAVYNDETKILLLEIESCDELRQLAPDYPALLASHDSINGVLVTAPANDGEYDFHSRYFWPWSGTNEDPVTGGTHTFLAPYWSSRLGKTNLKSFQSSSRSGFMSVEVREDGITIVGNAVIVLSGELHRIAMTT